MMSTTTLPSIIKTAAMIAVDKAALNVIRLVETKSRPASRKAFSNRMVRVVNGPDPPPMDLLESEYIQLQALRADKKFIIRRAHRETHFRQEQNRATERTLLELEKEEQHEALQLELAAADKRELQKKTRAEALVLNREKKRQLEEAHRASVHRALDTIRKSLMLSKPVYRSPPPIEPMELSENVRPIRFLDCRQRWKDFVKNHSQTALSRRLVAEQADIAKQKQKEASSAAEALAKRKLYGERVRKLHAPVVNVELHEEIVSRVKQIHNPSHVRRQRDVRRDHPVISGIPGTDKPTEEDVDEASNRVVYPDYLEELHQQRLQQGGVPGLNMNKEQTIERIASLEASIQVKERLTHRIDASPAMVAKDLAHLSQLYIMCLNAKVHLCDMYCDI